MNPLTNVKNVKKLSEAELKGHNKTSWHDQYRGSAWLFIGGLPFDLTEGDIICVFSQYGEPVNINLVRDKDSGKSKGYCFLCYEDQRSTDLAVDNLNGIKLLGRTVRVDHVDNYRPPKERKDDDEDTKTLKREGLAGVAVRTIKREEVSQVKVEYKREVSPKRKVKKKSPKIETSSDSDTAQKKQKSKKSRGVEKEKCKKKKTVSSSSSGSSSESSDSSDEPKKRKKRRRSTSSESSDSSDIEPKKKTHKLRSEKISEQEDDKKKSTKKHSKTIEELKREARLIHEELLRRQKAKDEPDSTHTEERKYRQDSPELKVKHRSPPRTYSEVAALPPRSFDRHNKHRKRSRSIERLRERPHSPNVPQRRRSKSPERYKHTRNEDDRSRRRSRSVDRPARRSRSPRVHDKYRPERLGRDVRGRERERPRSPPRHTRR